MPAVSPWVAPLRRSHGRMPATRTESWELAKTLPDTPRPVARRPVVAPPRQSALPLGSVVLRTARAVLDLTPADLARATGCSVTLVERIESGEADPTLDTVHRLLNTVGLELRCGPRPTPNNAYLQVTPSEVHRLVAAWKEACADRAQFGLGPPAPITDLQLPWDGEPPAPPHLFGAGPTRRHDGGWGAALVRSLRSRRGLTPAAFAAVVGLDETEVVRIESGAFRPPISEIQRIHSQVREALSVRVEVYDNHDDVLELDYIRDPESYTAAVYEIRNAIQQGMVIRRSPPPRRRSIAIEP